MLLQKRVKRHTPRPFSEHEPFFEEEERHEKL